MPNPRGVRPFSSRIVELRMLKPWTQEELAVKAGWDTRTVSRAETDVPIKPHALEDIARALGVTYLSIAVPEFLTGVEPQHWLSQMVDADLAGDFFNARRVGEALVGHLLSSSHELYVEACVRLAIVCDHQQEWERAIGVLNECLTRSAEGAPSRRWAIYQRGLIQHRFAEHLQSRTYGVVTNSIDELLRRAERDLTLLCATPGDDLSVACAHQLGVLWLHRGEVKRALSMFEDCLQRRLAADPNSGLATPYRLGYEYRRMAQCCSRLADRPNQSKSAQKKMADSARQYFDEARRLATETSHQRLLSDLDRDELAWRADASSIPDHWPAEFGH